MPSINMKLKPYLRFSSLIHIINQLLWIFYSFKYSSSLFGIRLRNDKCNHLLNFKSWTSGGKRGVTLKKNQNFECLSTNLLCACFIRVRQFDVHVQQQRQKYSDLLLNKSEPLKLQTNIFKPPISLTCLPTSLHTYAHTQLSHLNSNQFKIGFYSQSHACAFTDSGATSHHGNQMKISPSST